MKTPLSLTLTALLVAAAAPAAAATKVSFAKDVVPILKGICANCHLTGEEPGEMKLYPSAAYATLVNVPSKESPLLRISPGNPEKSYLMHKLDGTHLDAGGQGERMPFGLPPLDEADRQKFRDWIKGGAKNN